MASFTTSFNSNHEETIHDAQFDYYGKHLATASSDSTIKIFELQDNKQQHVATLTGHQGPVYGLSQAHPKYGRVLASCSYGRQLFIWKEVPVTFNQTNANNQNLNSNTSSPTQQVKIYEDLSFEASVNCVRQAPDELGLVLAACSSDGHITVYTFVNNNQNKAKFMAHSAGVNAISQSPAVNSVSLFTEAQKSEDSLTSGQQKLNSTLVNSKTDFVYRIVSAGCDNRVRMQSLNPSNPDSSVQSEVNCFNVAAPLTPNSNNTNTQSQHHSSEHHSDQVRDVAQAPNIGLLNNTFASCSDDQSVKIQTEEKGVQINSATLKFEVDVCGVSQSTMGNLLAIALANNRVLLWKENEEDGTQACLSELSQSEENELKHNVPNELVSLQEASVYQQQQQAGNLQSNTMNNQNINANIERVDGYNAENRVYAQGAQQQRSQPQTQQLSQQVYAGNGNVPLPQQPQLQSQPKIFNPQAASQQPNFSTPTSTNSIQHHLPPKVSTMNSNIQASPF